MINNSEAKNLKKAESYEFKGLTVKQFSEEGFCYVMKNVSRKYGNIRGISMSQTDRVIRIDKPKIPRNLPLVTDFDVRIYDEDQVTSKLISGCKLEGQNAEMVSFKNVVFRNVTFTDVSFVRADIEDVRFENCDLSNIDLSDSILNRVQIENCKLVGANFTEASLLNVVISNSNGRYANFRFLYCKKFVIEDSIFTYSDFQSSELNEIRFLDTELQCCQFSGTKLKGVDMSTCDISNIGVGIDEIRGACVSSLQAVSLSTLLGLKIKDPF